MVAKELQVNGLVIVSSTVENATVEVWMEGAQELHRFARCFTQTAQMHRLAVCGKQALVLTHGRYDLGRLGQ